MEYLKTRFRLNHLIVFAVIFVNFSVFTYVIAEKGLSPPSNQRVFQSTVGTITGPLTGAISRGFQTCCLSASLQVMKFCAPVLIFGILFQFIPFPPKTWFNVFRYIIWGSSWFIWFSGGILSFGHALS